MYKLHQSLHKCNIWIVNAGILGTPAETEVVSANLTGNALAYYYNIRNSVEQSSANPSYTYASQQEANAHPIEMNWNEANGRYEYTVTDENGLETMSSSSLYILKQIQVYNIQKMETQ